MFQPQAREPVDVARGMEVVHTAPCGGVGRRVVQRRVCRKGLQQRQQCCAVHARDRVVEHREAGFDDGPVAGTAAQVAGQRVAQGRPVGPGAARGVILVHGGQAHHEAWRAEAALRPVAIHHGLLGRVGRMGAAQVFHRQQRAAIQRGQELDAGIDRLQCHAPRGGGVGLTDDDGAGAAVAFRAAFLGAGAARILSQPLEHRSRWRHPADLLHPASVDESDRSGVAVHDGGPGAGFRGSVGAVMQGLAGMATLQGFPTKSARADRLLAKDTPGPGRCPLLGALRDIPAFEACIPRGTSASG